MIELFELSNRNLKAVTKNSPTRKSDRNILETSGKTENLSKEIEDIKKN